MVDLVKEVQASGRGKVSSQTLGLQQRPLKKVSFDTSSKEGHKKDQEKIKLVGELLVNFGLVKPIKAHFSYSSQ